jgi:HAD superfamily hydrolase (TIGR01662 family)
LIKKSSQFLFGDYNLTIMPAIKVILFDLGSTLIYSKDPWPPILAQSDWALLGALKKAGIAIDPASFHPGFDTFLDYYYVQRGTGTVEITTSSVLAKLLARQGFADVSADIVHAALNAAYGVTQQNWYLEEDAIPTLGKLQKDGYRLGMISNTSDDENVQQLVDRWGLRLFFERIITSAGCGIRKPDARIFRLALDHFAVAPAQAAMVGDLLEADVLGARRTGMYSIWITRRAEGPELEPGVHWNSVDVEPDASVSSLTEIPSVLAAIP